MSAVKGRTKRAVGQRKPLYAQVAAEHHAKASRAAQAMGISLGAYIDLVLGRDQVDVTGRPLWAPSEHMTFEELRQVS